MKVFENNTISLELAQKLKNSGFPQDKTLLVWREQQWSTLIWSISTRFYNLPVDEQIASPTAEEIANELVEKNYQLRIEFNHNDMKWYAYYAGKLRDKDIELGTGAETMAEALAILWLHKKVERVDTYSNGLGIVGKRIFYADGTVETKGFNT